MNTDIKLSTRFHQAQGAHEVGVLVTLSGEAPAQRPRINVALVLDRSGSMAGPPLEAAKDAATRFAGFLAAHDRVSVAVFDDQASVIVAPGPADHDAIGRAVRSIQPHGCTNLSAGWLLGRSHIEAALGEGTNRVVLFTDGQANRGMTDVRRLTDLVRGAADQRVSTTCIGFGADFQEELLSAMASAGNGNYWYVEHTDQMGDIFADEIEGLVALGAQNVTVEVRAVHERVQGVSFPQSFAITRASDGAWLASLGDLYATSPRSLGVILHVEDVGTLGETRLAEIRVSADVLTAEGIEHRVITMPVVANIAGRDAPEPTVETTLLRYAAARAREDAIRAADAGDLDRAADLLRRAGESLRGCTDAAAQEEAADLSEQATRIREHYAPRDRKYHLARSRAMHEDKSGYLSRTRRRPDPR